LCPLCKKPVYDGKKSFYCSGYNKENGCKFVIWKEIAGSEITVTDAKTLLEGKPISSRKFTSKAGKKFTASLIMNNQGKLEFVFMNKNRKRVKGKRHEK
jgi:DNA topoisomerase-3